ncbi:MAG: metallophosphoesterase [Alphaproteobacteria bacterium]|nr:MAG: metallophosphoesterase [Alphaproteobacteria bacterium]
MRFQLLSDLHLERQPNFNAEVASNVDALIIAGDIGSYQAGSLLKNQDFGLGSFSPQNGKWKKVFFVPGNHEYDQLDFSETHNRLKVLCDDLGITLLERSTYVADDIRIIGTTLWSDFDALVTTLGSDPTPTQILKLREKAYRAANFYLRKYSTLLDGKPMLAEQMRDLSLDCQAWLEEELKKPFEGKTLVITHFAPSLRSADPRYGITPGTAGFCNSLDHLFPSVDVWVHGHLHCPNQYQVGRCRVVSNSLGYANKGEQAGFVPTFVFDI